MSSNFFGGFRVIEAPWLVETVQHSRSPARAKRRARRGFRQCFKTRPSQEALIVNFDIFAHSVIVGQIVNLGRVMKVPAR